MKHLILIPFLLFFAFFAGNEVFAYNKYNQTGAKMNNQILLSGTPLCSSTLKRRIQKRA